MCRKRFPARVRARIEKPLGRLPAWKERNRNSPVVFPGHVTLKSILGANGQTENKALPWLDDPKFGTKDEP